MTILKRRREAAPDIYTADKSFLFFKQSIILFSVSLFLFILTTFFHLGVIGVIVFIRALFMLKSEIKSFMKYNIYETESRISIQRDDEKYILNKEKIKKYDLISKKFYDELHIEYDTGEEENSYFIFKYLLK